jgi:hypothetical protein
MLLFPQPPTEPDGTLAGLSGSHTPFPGSRPPPVALRPVAGFPTLRLLRPLCAPRALTP